MNRARLSFVVVAMILSHAAEAQPTGQPSCRLLAFGDVNLGRQVGQRIFDGDTLYPFREIGDLLAGADVVFANLESPLTDQGGETRHPSDAYRFCGPRAGAATLARAGIDVVAGANNHAYDYGRRGVLETLSSLEEASVLVTGLRSGTKSPTEPVVCEVNGVRVGFVSYTEFVNMPGRWGDQIMLFDASRARREIGTLHAKVDFIVASYHGGTEYTPGPPRGTLRNLRALADAGADLVLGHHPHVPQGVEIYRGSIICYSLGNFVFYQPQHFWTQLGLAACLHIDKAANLTAVDVFHLIPFRAGLQPTADLTEHEYDSLEARFNATSPSLLRRDGSSFILSMYDHSHF